MLHNISLKEHHTFGLNIQAEQYITIDHEAALKALIPLQQPYLILGGGSNVLFTKNVSGLVLHNQIKGIDIVEQTGDAIIVRVGGGEVWHELVLWSLKQGYGGLENMSLIPGSVGAAPIQNIGAYGVELKDVFHKLEAIHLETGETQTFDATACAFGYRNSVFKQALKGQYFITRVYLSLSKQAALNISYGAIQKVLEEQTLAPSFKTISDAVIQIRKSKLPDPKEIGNSGSFFKNPILPIAQIKQLQKDFPNIPVYPVDETSSKVAAGWLIDQLGWKGYRKGDAGVHKNQALVLVNYGKATGAEIWALAQQIQKSVQEKYNIDLEAEVNIL